MLTGYHICHVSCLSEKCSHQNSKMKILKITLWSSNFLTWVMCTIWHEKCVSALFINLAVGVCPLLNVIANSLINSHIFSILSQVLCWIFLSIFLSEWRMWKAAAVAVNNRWVQSSSLYGTFPCLRSKPSYQQSFISCWKLSIMLKLLLPKGYHNLLSVHNVNRSNISSTQQDKPAVSAKRGVSEIVPGRQKARGGTV